MEDLSRRQFVGAAAIGVAAAPAFSSASALAATEKKWPGLKDALVLNNLGSINNPNQRQRRGRFNLDDRALQDALNSGMTMVNQTIGYVAGPMEPFEHSVGTIAASNRVIENHSEHLIKILSTDDILQAKRECKIGILQGFQNAAMMGEDAKRVAIFAGLGVRIIQLTYNIRNQLGDGSMVPENRGITEFGREVIEQINTNNVAIDLSHSGQQTALDAIAASKKPVCISHTGARALANLPRNKSDEELRLLADKGGVVGIYFMPFLKEDSFPEAMDVVRHIEHAINICGEDHVGIGTDGGTTQIDDLEAMRSAVAKQVKQRQSLGIAAKGERAGVVPFIPEIQGPRQFQQLADMLYNRGHSTALIEKILGRNFLHFYKEVWRN